MSITDKEVIVENSPNSTVSIHKGVNVFKGKVKPCYPLDDVKRSQNERCCSRYWRNSKKKSA